MCMSDMIVDFTGCERVHRPYGGTDRKFGVIYDGSVYMLKFAKNHAGPDNVGSSDINNALAEYISSHIAGSIGIPVHGTVLGLYNGEIVVGCRDFRATPCVQTIEFSEYVHGVYHSCDIGRTLYLEQLYKTLSAPESGIPVSLQTATIDRYWDMYVIDALVGNFDRHTGNWGYLAKGEQLWLAPAYDFGSSLFPQASDNDIYGFLNDEMEMLRRCLIFPTSSLILSSEKPVRIGYYDILASDYDVNCTQAVLRIYHKIDLEAIFSIIDQTPFITSLRRDFYKKILRKRYEVILKRAFERCLHREFDPAARSRIENGYRFGEEDLVKFMQQEMI